MKPFNDQMGNMLWFTGVVEDRGDPEQIGRIRVRIFGDHTSDKVKIPTRDLPWAQVMMPITSASVGGIGDSATGIVQGSWVVGFYLDGESKQQPLVLGTIPGVSNKLSSGDAFEDPIGENPKRIGADTPFSATDDFYKKHNSYVTKVSSRVDDVECARPSKVSTVSQDEADSYYETPTWSSPEVMSGDSTSYPYNKVKETESGHVFEIDDTPGNERISQFHRTGTSYEIQNDGSKTETIMGNGYRVVFGSDNMYIKGNVNLTIDGDLRQLVKGNYHLEVNGNKTEFIRGSRQTKIAQNDQIEIDQSYAENITQNHISHVAGNKTQLIDGDDLTTIQGKSDLTVMGDYARMVMATTKSFSAGNHTMVINDALDVTALGEIRVATPSNVIKNIDGNVTNTIGGTLTETAPTIAATYTDGDIVTDTVSLVTHIHTGDSDIDGVTGAPQK